MILKLLILVFPYVSTLSPLSSTKAVTDGFGVNIHFTHPKVGEMDMIAAAGFKWVRMDFFWKYTEKIKGEYNFAEYEFLMSELVKYNMSALLILDFGNTLYDKDVAVLTEEGRKAYARWAATAVEHFKGRGILWEIWNEPNGDGFWNGHQDVHQYVAMALEAVKAIRAKSPNELIIGPATSQVAFGYLEECFKAGLLNYWDAVSVHPYRQSEPETVVYDYYRLKSLIAKYAPKGKTIPVISGEWGYSTSWKNFNTTIQGKYLTRQLLTNVMNNIPVSIWYDWHDDGINKTDAEHNFGIVHYEYHSGSHPVYTPKESYLSSKTMNSFLKGFHYVKRIATKDVDDYVLLFSNGKELKMVAWTSSVISKQIIIPSDKCDFEIINSKGDKHENTSSKEGSLTLTSDDSTHYIIVKGQNHALETQPDSNVFRVNMESTGGKVISIRIFNLYGTKFNGTVLLRDVKGLEPSITEVHFQNENQFETLINFNLKSKPVNNFSFGLIVEGYGVVHNFPLQRFQFLPDHSITDCIITADGDSKVNSEQTLSFHSAPEPLMDSNSTVLKIDYHFYGKGWKYLNVFPNKNENRKIADQPKAFGIWVYGDNQGISIKIRLRDSSNQSFQIEPESQLYIDWIGWRYVKLNLNDVHSRWGGANDGIVHFPIEWQTLFLLDNVRESNVKSTIYISAPIIIY